MKIQELRIGVYLELPTRNEPIVIVEEILKNNFIICDITSNEWPLCDYKPILLTEQWLKDFGFVYTEYRNWEKSSEDFGIEFNEDEFYFHVYGNAFNFQYVHQLQNLYFVLTGKELIKNP